MSIMAYESVRTKLICGSMDGQKVNSQLLDRELALQSNIRLYH